MTLITVASRLDNCQMPCLASSEPSGAPHRFGPVELRPINGTDSYLLGLPSRATQPHSLSWEGNHFNAKLNFET